MRKALIFALLIILAGCGIIAQHPKVAGMLTPTTFVYGTTTAKVLNKVSEVCDRNGFQILKPLPKA